MNVWKFPARQHWGESLAQRDRFGFWENVGITPHRRDAPGERFAAEGGANACQVVARIQHASILRTDGLRRICGQRLSTASAFEVGDASHAKVKSNIRGLMLFRSDGGRVRQDRAASIKHWLCETRDVPGAAGSPAWSVSSRGFLGPIHALRQFFPAIPETWRSCNRFQR